MTRIVDGHQQRRGAIAGTVFDPAVNPGSPYKVGDNVSSLFRVAYAPERHRERQPRLDDLPRRRRRPGALTSTTATRAASTTGHHRCGRAEFSTFYSIPAYGLLDGKLTGTSIPAAASEQ